MSRFITTDIPFTLLSGLPNALGTVYFGLPGQDAQSNPKVPYLDAALTTPSTATQNLTSGGKLQQKLYLDGDYSFIVDDVDDVQVFEDLNGALLFIDASAVNYTADASVGQKLDNLDVDDYAQLKAITVSQLEDNDTVNVGWRLTENDGGGGQFRWDESDLSTQVTSDDQEGFYVAPDSDDTGTNGAFVRKRHELIIDAEWFGGYTVDVGLTIQSAHDQASSGQTVRFSQTGTFPQLTTINWSKDFTKYIGPGIGTIFEQQNDLDGMLVTGIFCEFENLMLYSAGNDIGRDGLAWSGQRTYLKRVFVNGYSQYGFRHIDGNHCKLDFCRATNCFDGYYGGTTTADNNANEFSLCIFNDNTNYGFHLPASGTAINESRHHHGFIVAAFNTNENAYIETSKNVFIFYLEGAAEPEGVLTANSKVNHISMVEGDMGDSGEWNQVIAIDESPTAKPVKYYRIADSGWDYQTGDLTIDGSFHELDLATDITAITTDTVAVYLRVLLKGPVAGIGDTFEIKADGETANESTPILRTLVANTNHEFYLQVPVIGGKVDYRLNNVVWQTVNLKIINYWRF